MSERAERTREDRGGGSGEGLLEIGNAIVGLHKEYYGRGPTKVRTGMLKDALIVVLEGGFSRGETTLATSGRTESVRQSRHEMQEVIKDRWIEVVEAKLGRTVR